jgi:hypothetical protein
MAECGRRSVIAHPGSSFVEPVKLNLIKSPNTAPYRTGNHPRSSSGPPQFARQVLPAATLTRLRRFDPASEGHVMADERSAATMLQEIEFAPDSPLEGSGFELPVPRALEERCRNDKLRSRAMVRWLVLGARSVHGGTGSSNPLCSSSESDANRRDSYEGGLPSPAVFQALGKTAPCTSAPSTS